MITSIKRVVTWLKWIIIALIGIALVVLVGFRIFALLREKKTIAEAAPSTGKFISLAGENMFIQEVGNETDPAMLFIHGTGAWSETWRDTMNVVAHAGFRAIALDMPPFGFSELPNDNSYSRQDQAKRIEGVLNALNVNKVILVGHSYGAGATVEAAMNMPERVQALILVDAALGIGATSTEQSFLLATTLKIKPFRNALVATTLSNPLFTRTLLKKFIKDPAHATDAWVKIYQAPMNVEGKTNAVGEWLPTLLVADTKSQSVQPENYRSLRIPTYIIWGEADAITPLKLGVELKSLVPDAKLKVLPVVGHIPQIEDPGQFHTTLLEFLQTY
jgi:pimeloyl-ACP methyl ester carboxylesterase